MRAKEDGTILLDGDELKRLCKPGEGADTCIWAMSGADGLACHYYNRPNGLVSRWNQGLTVAKRNGCPEVRVLALPIKYVEAETLEDIVRGEIPFRRTLAG